MTWLTNMRVGACALYPLSLSIAALLLLVVQTDAQSVDAPAAMTLDVCPTSYQGFPKDGPPLTCGCIAAAMKEGNVWGANPYFNQSAICKAAQHTGVLGPQGGQVVVTPAPDQPVFPSVSRNGIVSSSYPGGMGFRVAAVASAAPALPAAPKPAVDASGQPVQAPIADTLRVAGRVQVYVNFATDSDRLEGSSDAVLHELLTTLQGDPALRVELIGHTDSTGSAPHNLDLSERRAASVYLWLTQHGIARERLRSSGRGMTEPIADNATVEGRALNRRVEVKTTN